MADQRIFERIFETTWLTVVDTHFIFTPTRARQGAREPRLVCASDCAAGAGLMLTRINPARAGQPPLSGPPLDTIVLSIVVGHITVKTESSLPGHSLRPGPQLTSPSAEYSASGPDFRVGRGLSTERFLGPRRCRTGIERGAFQERRHYAPVPGLRGRGRSPIPGSHRGVCARGPAGPPAGPPGAVICQHHNP